jgi:hypothetical protein
MTFWLVCIDGRVIVYTKEDKVGEEDGPYVLG